MKVRYLNVREAALLALLSKKPAYGFELVEESPALIEGGMPKGGVYNLLYKLRGLGFVNAAERTATSSEKGGNDRLYYSITPEGRKSLDDFFSTVQNLRTRSGTESPETT